MQEAPITLTYQHVMTTLLEGLGSREFPDFEPGEIAVPVDGVLAGDRQGGDAAGGEAEGASLRHGYPRREARTRAEGPERVIKPQTCGINPWG